MKYTYYCFLMATIILGHSSNLDAQTEQSMELLSNDLFQKQKKNIIKFNILSASVLEHLEFTYERAIAPRQSIEAKVGFIGLGLITHEQVKIQDVNGNEKNHPRVDNGMFFAAGYKFFKPNTNSSKKKKNPHILKGFYLQPEIIGGFYSRNNLQRTEPQQFIKQKINYQAALLNVGIQGIIKNRIVFDLFVGWGIGKDNLPDVEDSFLYFGEFHRGLYKTTTGISGAGKAGLRIGFLF